MAEHKPHPANVPGEFYVEDGCCTTCEAPFAEAPELFGFCPDAKGYPHCFIKRQPIMADELDQMVSAIRVAELQCIRYRGGDRLIQLRLIASGDKEVCDHLPPDLEPAGDPTSWRDRFWLWLYGAAKHPDEPTNEPPNSPK